MKTISKSDIFLTQSLSQTWRVHADGTEKAENYDIKKIFIFCVSTCDDNNAFSVSSVFRFFRYIYNIGGRNGKL